MVINPPKRWSNWSESMCWFRIWTLVAKLVKITQISLGLIRGIYPVEGWHFGIKHHEPAELKPSFNLQSWLRYNSINLIVGIPIVFSSISGCPLLHPPYSRWFLSRLTHSSPFLTNWVHGAQGRLAIVRSSGRHWPLHCDLLWKHGWWLN